MTIHKLRDRPPDEMARSLARFERQFRYPLGKGHTFTISHGEDYTRHYRSMGDAVCFVAERDGQVLGTLSGAIRNVIHPDGSSLRTAYLGDLKAIAGPVRGRALLGLAREASAWAQGNVRTAYSVVMDGTAATPGNYGGRLDIPPFLPIAKIVVLRLATSPGEVDGSILASASRGLNCARMLGAGSWLCLAGEPHLRSISAPQWLVAQDCSACGMLEDTLGAKQLFSESGEEMRSAHLSTFASSDLAGAIMLLTQAVRFAHELGFPALFVAVPASDACPIIDSLPRAPLSVAPATVFAAGLPPGDSWRINTSEI